MSEQMEIVNEKLTRNRLVFINKVIIFCGIILIGCTHPYCPEEDDVINEFRIKLKPGIEGKDAISMPEQFGKNFGDTSVLAYLYEDESGLNKGNGFIEFDLEQLPSDVKLKRAVLKLFIYTTDSTFLRIPLSDIINSNGWSLRAVIQPWDEHISMYSNEPLTSGAVKIQFPPNDSSFSCSIDVTQLIAKEIERPANYFGFIIVPPFEQSKYQFNYCSSDHPYSRFHPELIIDYEC
ncbi:DNRLRE domain-containing protein [Sporocytophaga myxococcoides]|uniref:DNRLRE domain-containing protein n=1 Tax=Sporocytophaga myxococcoides TaxID=153721 RepID=UPI0004911B8F|nr:DNRLRE domain-containing protein [Sporocytophaga myxococcoides]